MKKPIIGITADLMKRKEGIHAGELQQFLNDCYAQRIIEAGGLPIILPVFSNDYDKNQNIEKDISNLCGIIDGLVLSGGGDINPLLYGEEPAPELNNVDYNRDLSEIALVKAAKQKKIPVLAICRGVQILNVAYGGTLYQHLSTEIFKVQHHQKTTGDFASHTVILKKGGKLARIFSESGSKDSKEITANSFHHQAVKDVAPLFTATAFSKDGVIEAIENIEEGPFIIGVQWHPERMPSKMRCLFQAFIKAAARDDTT